jgi:hypothetical protein
VAERDGFEPSVWISTPAVAIRSEAPVPRRHSHPRPRLNASAPIIESRTALGRAIVRIYTHGSFDTGSNMGSGSTYSMAAFHIGLSPLNNLLKRSFKRLCAIMAKRSLSLESPIGDL